MTASPLIDQYAAAIRQRNAAKSAKDRAGLRSLAKRAAADIQANLPGIAPEVVGAVVLRVAGFVHNVEYAHPGATAREAANLLDLAGERLYHHGGQGDGETECEA